MTRITITHLSGSKANQTESFEMERFEELILGRDPAATIVFDPQRDDLVSRQHAAIRITKDTPPNYLLGDKGSSNGTFHNGRPVKGEVTLAPGDTIELGEGGPRLSLDLEPRPLPAVPPTRLNTKALDETRISRPSAATRPAASATGAAKTAGDTSTAKSTARPTEKPADNRVGKETVMRMMDQQRRSTSRKIAIGGGIAVVLIGIIVGALIHFGVLFGKSPKEIVAEFGDATVVVEAHYRIIDKSTGRPIYQRTCVLDNSPLPCFLQFDNGPVMRWLTVDDDDHRGLPIESAGSGSGFIVNDSGFILTNKHVAQGWRVPQWDNFGVEAGILINLVQGKLQIGRFNPMNFASLRGWDFDNPVKLIRPDFRVPGGMGFSIASDAMLDGRNESLTVRFPNTRDSIDAQLVKASADADVAEIKIASSQKLPTINLASVGSRPSVGERVIVLGYPGISEQKVAIIQSSEGGKIKERMEVIPQPTVTEGIIANLGDAVKTEKNVQTFDTLGDVYQLTVTATGHGNSGGPVFNSDGKVIGLFTYSRSRGDERVTFAVPIQYGLDLLLH